MLTWDNQISAKFQRGLKLVQEFLPEGRIIVEPDRLVCWSDISRLGCEISTTFSNFPLELAGMYGLDLSLDTKSFVPVRWEKFPVLPTGNLVRLESDQKGRLSLLPALAEFAQKIKPEDISARWISASIPGHLFDVLNWSVTGVVQIRVYAVDLVV